MRRQCRDVAKEEGSIIRKLPGSKAAARCTLQTRGYIVSKTDVFVSPRGVPVDGKVAMPIVEKPVVLPTVTANGRQANPPKNIIAPWCALKIMKPRLRPFLMPILSTSAERLYFFFFFFNSCFMSMCNPMGYDRPTPCFTDGRKWRCVFSKCIQA